MSCKRRVKIRDSRYDKKKGDGKVENFRWSVNKERVKIRDRTDPMDGYADGPESDHTEKDPVPEFRTRRTAFERRVLPKTHSYGLRKVHTLKTRRVQHRPLK
jgi:hypothetical protein